MKFGNCWGCGQIKKLSRENLGDILVWICKKCKNKLKEMHNEV